MENTKIEWCDSSWNPVSGCLNECPYCYARRTAHRFKGCNIAPDGKSDRQVVRLKDRLPVTNGDGVTRNAAYPFGFTPTLHEYRLDDPVKKKFGKNIFVCSMADLFGDWIPESWILDVFDACKKAPDHRYLFLTKNPARYIDLAVKGLLPEDDNFWYGSTTESPDKAAFFSDKHNTFVSIEPIMAPFGTVLASDGISAAADWVILGAETGTRSNKVVPERGWIESVVDSFLCNGKPVFMKDSMKPIWGDDLLRQFPWGDKNE